jgi:hypothetical protein
LDEVYYQKLDGHQDREGGSSHRAESKAMRELKDLFEKLKEDFHNVP